LLRISRISPKFLLSAQCLESYFAALKSCFKNLIKRKSVALQTFENKIEEFISTLSDLESAITKQDTEQYCALFERILDEQLAFFGENMHRYFSLLTGENIVKTYPSLARLLDLFFKARNWQFLNEPSSYRFRLLVRSCFFLIRQHSSFKTKSAFEGDSFLFFSYVWALTRFAEQRANNGNPSFWIALGEELLQARSWFLEDWLFSSTLMPEEIVDLSFAALQKKLRQEIHHLSESYIQFLKESLSKLERFLSLSEGKNCHKRIETLKKLIELLNANCA
jgi:hypothetical protein